MKGPAVDLEPTTTHHTRRATRIAASAALVAMSVLLAACVSVTTSTSNGPTTSTYPQTPITAPPTTAPYVQGPAALGTLIALLGKTTGESFDTSYQVTNIAQGANSTQTIGLYQAPPKTAANLGTTNFYANGTSVIKCTGPSGQTVCVSLPPSSTDMAAVTNPVAPSAIITALHTLQANTAASTSNLTVVASVATYANLPSTCAKVTSPTATSTYCVSNTTGLLTYANTGGTLVLLTEYSLAPDPGLFTPPSGVPITPAA